MVFPSSLTDAVLKANRQQFLRFNGKLQRQFRENVFSIAHLLGFSVAIALFALCCWGVFRMAPWLVRLLGQTGINVITRIMGLLLMALGIEFIVTGIKGIFPGLLN